MRLDDIDIRILAALQQNARLTNVELAEKVGLSPSPCLRRVRMLERDGVIRRYVTLVEPSVVGLAVNVFVQVRLERQAEEYLRRFETAVKDWPEVMECYLMTGDADYHLRIAVRDLVAYENFLKEKLTRIDGISNIRSSFALKQVSYRTDLPLQRQPADGPNPH